MSTYSNYFDVGNIGVFEDRIGKAIQSEKREGIAYLMRECEARLVLVVSPEHYRFYTEALTLLSSSLLIAVINLHEKLIDKSRISEVNDSIELLFVQSTKIAKLIQESFFDPDLFKSLKAAPADKVHVPYEDVHIFPEKKQLARMQENFIEGFIKEPLFFSETDAQVMEVEARQLYGHFNHFYNEITESLWLELESFQQEDDAPLPPIRGEARHFTNLMVGEYAKGKQLGDVCFMEGRIRGDGDCGFSATNTTREQVVQYLLEHRNEADIRELIAPEIKGWLKGVVLGESCLPSAAKEGMERYHKLHQEMDQMLRKLQEYLKGATDHEVVLDLEGLTKDEIILNWNSVYRDLPNGEIFDEVPLPEGFVDDYSENYLTADALLEDLSCNKIVFATYVQVWYAEGYYLILPDPGTTGVMDVMAKWLKTPIRVWKLNEEGGENEVYLRHIAGTIDDSNRNKVLDIIHRSIHFNKLIPSLEFEISGETPELGSVKRFAALNV